MIKAPQKSLKDWSDQKWRTKSGKPSSKTGERYLPEAAIKSLSPAEYAATTRAKRAGKAAGSAAQDYCKENSKVQIMAKTPAWQRKEGKSEKGGLNAKGRASYNKANPDKPGLKAPQPEGGSRKKSFCARMSGMKKKLTSAKTANDPNSRINKSLRAWKC